MGKTVRLSFEDENLQEMGKWTEYVCFLLSNHKMYNLCTKYVYLLLLDRYAYYCPVNTDTIIMNDYACVFF